MLPTADLNAIHVDLVIQLRFVTYNNLDDTTAHPQPPLRPDPLPNSEILSAQPVSEAHHSNLDGSARPQSRRSRRPLPLQQLPIVEDLNLVDLNAHTSDELDTLVSNLDSARAASTGDLVNTLLPQSRLRLNTLDDTLNTTDSCLPPSTHSTQNGTRSSTTHPASTGRPHDRTVAHTTALSLTRSHCRCTRQPCQQYLYHRWTQFEPEQHPVVHGAPSVDHWSTRQHRRCTRSANSAPRLDQQSQHCTVTPSLDEIRTAVPPPLNRLRQHCTIAPPLDRSTPSLAHSNHICTAAPPPLDHQSQIHTVTTPPNLTICSAHGSDIAEPHHLQRPQQ